MSLLDMLGVFAEFLTNLRRKRQAEGIAHTKQQGVYTSGKRFIEREEVVALIGQGLSRAAIARQLGVSRWQTYPIHNDLANRAAK